MMRAVAIPISLLSTFSAHPHTLSYTTRLFFNDCSNVLVYAPQSTAYATYCKNALNGTVHIHASQGVECVDNIAIFVAHPESLSIEVVG